MNHHPQKDVEAPLPPPQAEVVVETEEEEKKNHDSGFRGTVRAVVNYWKTPRPCDVYFLGAGLVFLFALFFNYRDHKRGKILPGDGSLTLELLAMLVLLALSAAEAFVWPLIVVLGLLNGLVYFFP